MNIEKSAKKFVSKLSKRVRVILSSETEQQLTGEVISLMKAAQQEGFEFPYMESMFAAQDIVEMLTEDSGANVRIIANALRQHGASQGVDPEKWDGFAKCKKCGKVQVAHPLRHCVNFSK